VNLPTNSTTWLVMKLQFEKASKVKESNPLEVVCEKQKGSNAFYAFLDFEEIVI